MPNPLNDQYLYNGEHRTLPEEVIRRANDQALVPTFLTRVKAAISAFKSLPPPSVHWELSSLEYMAAMEPNVYTKESRSFHFIFGNGGREMAWQSFAGGTVNRSAAFTG